MFNKKIMVFLDGRDGGKQTYSFAGSLCWCAGLYLLPRARGRNTAAVLPLICGWIQGALALGTCPGMLACGCLWLRKKLLTIAFIL